MTKIEDTNLKHEIKHYTYLQKLTYPFPMINYKVLLCTFSKCLNELIYISYESHLLRNKNPE